MTDLSLLSVAQCERRLRRNQIAMAVAALAGYLFTYGVFSTLLMRVLPNAWTSWVVAVLISYSTVRIVLWSWNEDVLGLRQRSRLLTRAEGWYASFAERAAGPRPLTRYLSHQRRINPLLTAPGVFGDMGRELLFRQDSNLYRDALLETLWAYRARWAALLVAGPIQVLPAALAVTFLFATA